MPSSRIVSVGALALVVNPIYPITSFSDRFDPSITSILSKSTLLGGILTVIFAAVSPMSQAAEPTDNSKPEVMRQANSAAGTVAVNAPPAQKTEVKVEAKMRSEFDPEITTTVSPRAERLPAFVTTANRYKALITPGELLRIKLYNRLNLQGGWFGIGIGPFVFTPGRVPQSPKSVACTVQEVDVHQPLEPSTDAHVIVEHRSSPSVTLDGALQSVLDFGLSSQRDNATAQFPKQGVVLRGISSDSTSALVLLDGVPLNDAFGGGVEWSAVPHEGLDRAEFVLGGGATAWGNGSLGGVVQFFTLPANGKLVQEPGTPNDGGPPDPNLTKQVVRQVTQLATNFGQYGTRSAELVSAQPTDVGVLQVLGRAFSTNGYPVVASGNRGTIDRDAWSRQQMFEVRWCQPLGESLDLTTTVSSYHASNGDGTPDQQTRSGGELVSVAMAKAPSPALDFAWNGVVYIRHRSAADTFTAVDATRSAETPIISKPSAPATTFGASWTGLWWDPGEGQGRTVVGSDLNFVRGEVRENLAFANGTFTRELVAGGEQGIIGFFASRDQPIASTVRATVAARLDLWKDTDGHRREMDRLTGIQFSDNLHGIANGNAFCPSAGLIWQPTGKWRVRTNAQQSFRRPTLGERYETYGHNFIVTEPNPELRTEQNRSIEMGAEYRPVETVTLEATAFSHELRDALGKIRVARGSSDYPLVDTLPSGYFVQKRINLDRARVQGLKLSTDWNPNAALKFAASVLVSEPIILRSNLSPTLQGKQMAQASRRTAMLSAWWQAPAKITFRFNLRYLGRQFVDDEDTLRLNEAVVADLGVSYELTKHTELYLTADNLANTVVETSRSDDGVVNIGSPRVILVGVRLQW